MANGAGGFVSDTVRVMTGNVVYVLCETAVGLLYPLMLGITDYGYFKIFSLYAAYTAFLQLGMTDGLSMELAGRTYDSLERPAMRAYTRSFIAVQTAAGLIIAAFSAVALSDEYRFIGIVIALRAAAINVTTYYRAVSEATCRFSEYSVLGVVSALLRFTAAVVLAAVCGMGNVSYRWYLYASAAIWIGVMLWYAMRYRDITFGRAEKLSRTLPMLRRTVGRGILLTASAELLRVVGMLDRQIVSLAYSTDDYAVYAFAHSMLAVGTTVTASVAVVLFPYLKRLGERAVRHFSDTLSLFSALCGICLAGYFPLEVFVRTLMADYAPSLEYLRLLMPQLIFSGAVTVIIFTYYKVSGRLGGCLAAGAASIAMSLALELSAQAIFGSIRAVCAAASVASAAAYLIYLLCFLRRHKKSPWLRSFVLSCITSAAFCTVTALTLPTVAKMFIYIAVSAVTAAASGVTPKRIREIVQSKHSAEPKA